MLDNSESGTNVSWTLFDCNHIGFVYARHRQQSKIRNGKATKPV